MNPAFLSMCFIFLASTAQADEAGLQIAEVFLPHHGKSAKAAIWYPSASNEMTTSYAGNAIFEGVDAVSGGVLATGRYPLVLFSHGIGGTDRAQAWLGAALAERGAITVMINHPNSTWGDFDMSKGIRHWTRAHDLSAALDALLSNPFYAESIDPTRIMAAGFSFGGWTALSLGGMTGNHAGIVQACAAYPDMEGCQLFVSSEVNMQGVDPDAWNANYGDQRITHVAALDPGFVWGLEQSDLKQLVPASLVVGFGAGNDRMLATDFDRSGLTDLLGDRRVERLEPAFHFSAMPLCTAEGEAILREENDDPVCTDPDGSDRSAIHAKVVDLLVEMLEN